MDKLVIPDPLANVNTWINNIGNSLENYKTVWLTKLKEKVEGFQTTINTNAPYLVKLGEIDN